MKIGYFIIISLLGSVLCDDSEVTKVFKETEVIPDMFEEGPKDFLKITFESGAVTDNKGGELTPTQMKDEPILEWTIEPGAFYTVIMSGVDAPDRKDPKWREWLHWLVVNVPGADIDKGEVIAPYFSPAPPKNSGLMRFVFLVYKQPSELQFDEDRLSATSADGHAGFSSYKFAEKYNMGPPVAGSIVNSQWDEYVDELLAQLNLTI